MTTLRWGCNFTPTIDETPPPPPPPPGGGGGGTGVPATDLVVSVQPADPQLGEVFNVTTAKTSGQPFSVDDLKSEWVWGEMGASVEPFINQPSRDKNWAPGRNFIHAYTDGIVGTRNFQVKAWRNSTGTRYVDASVNVVNPDNHPFTTVYWVDFNGDTSGMPAEGSVDGNGSVNRRVTSFAQWASLSISGASARVRFRGGATHLFTPTFSSQRPSLSASLLRIDTFGSGYAMLDVRPTSWMSYALFFRTQANHRTILHKLDIDGHYSILTGRYVYGAVIAVQCAAVTEARVSVVDCRGSGLTRLHTKSGTSANLALGGVFDSFCQNGQDYGLGTVGGDDGFGIRGCHTITDIFTPRGDSKTGLQTDFPDHAWYRNNGPRKFYVAQNTAACRGGWSFSGTDRAPQAFVRSHSQDNAVEGLTEVLFNKSFGYNLLFCGTHTDPNGQQVVSRTLCVGNDHDFSPHGRTMVNSRGAGGNVMYSNVCWLSDASYAQVNDGGAEFYQQGPGGNASTAVRAEPNYVGFNTMASDATASRFCGIGPLNRVSILDTAAVVTEEANIMAGDNHTGTGLTPMSQLSRGDSFRILTGAAAAVSVPATVPISFDRYLLEATTLVGAHSTTGATVSVNPPQIGAVTIGRLNDFSATNNSNSYGVIAHSGLIEAGFTVVDFRWYNAATDQLFLRDGTDRMYLHPVFDFTGFPGSYYLEVGLLNRSGTRVTRRSNTVVVT